MPRREKFMCFSVFPEEREKIKSNAKKVGRSGAGFVRDRALKHEITNNEVVDMIQKFVWRTCKIDRGVIKTTGATESWKPKKGSPPPQLCIDTTGMTQEQIQMYMDSVKKVNAGAKEMFAELIEKTAPMRRKLEAEDIDVLGEEVIET